MNRLPKGKRVDAADLFYVDAVPESPPTPRVYTHATYTDEDKATIHVSNDAEEREREIAARRRVVATYKEALRRDRPLQIGRSRGGIEKARKVAEKATTEWRAVEDDKADLRRRADDSDSDMRRPTDADAAKEYLNRVDSAFSPRSPYPTLTRACARSSTRSTR